MIEGGRIKTNKIRITDHFVQRYIERVGPFYGFYQILEQVDSAVEIEPRNEFKKVVYRKYPGSRFFKTDNFVFRMCGKKLITVTPFKSNVYKVRTVETNKMECPLRKAIRDMEELDNA